jgi:hypothetical protein
MPLATLRRGMTYDSRDSRRAASTARRQLDLGVSQGLLENGNGCRTVGRALGNGRIHLGVTHLSLTPGVGVSDVALVFLGKRLTVRDVTRLGGGRQIRGERKTRKR